MSSGKQLYLGGGGNNGAHISKLTNANIAWFIVSSLKYLKGKLLQMHMPFVRVQAVSNSGPEFIIAKQ